MSKINMELELAEKKLREEKDRLHLLHSEKELANFITSQELDNSKTSLARLKESTALLEEECRVLRAREQRDRERMKSLQEELETKERAFKEKLIELKTENTRAMNEVYHWKKKYGELEARALRMVEENLKERERINAPNLAPKNAVKTIVDSDDGDEMVANTSDHTAAPEEGLQISTPEPKRMRIPKVELMSSDGDEEDFVSIGDLRKKKKKKMRLAEEAPPSEKTSAPISQLHCSVREELATKEEAFKEKMIELKTENTRATDEVYHWKKKYGELEARALRMVEENLKERERNAPKNAVLKTIDSNDDDDDEMVANASDHKAPEEGLQMLTPEPKRMRTPKVELKSSDDDEEVLVPIGDLRKKKRLEEVAPSSEKTSAPISRRHCGAREDGAKETSAKVTEARFPAVATNDTHKAAEVGLPSYPKWRAYNGRTSSRDLQVSALMRAEKHQSELKACHPSFVRSIVRSHVSSCFWLGLSTKFCNDNLPPTTLRMVLEDENGLECETTYIGSRTGLSGGWRAFALLHDLEIGDALVFELITPTRFKVYIFKAISEETNKDIVENVADEISSARGAKSIIRRRII